MVFSSVPQDAPNWHHQHLQVQQPNLHEETTVNAKLQPPSYGGSKPSSMSERGKIPQPETGLIKCPRCESTNTKFCYFNNYNLSQPRHLCKTCRRYWTRGGVLRNVPVGGGCRRNKKTMSSSKSHGSSSIQLSFLSSLQNLGLNLHGHDSILSADQGNFPFLAGGFGLMAPINSNNEATTRSRVSGDVKMEESQLGLRSVATPFWGNNNEQYYYSN